ncbi:MAG: tyrosine-type recombinase/integrase [Acidobacteria bacterium]|nr:tyrosine-type recombinase/integrase [Acidobacteriota bacterium]
MVNTINFIPFFHKTSEASLKNVKQRTGQIFQNKNGDWTARVGYKNNNGKRTAVQRIAKTKTDARKILKHLLKTLEDGGRKALDAEKITVNSLCDYYLKNYANPPYYVNDRKVAGLRSHVQIKGYINVFREFFGAVRLQSLTYDDLREFRIQRLLTPTHQSSQRTIASVNRELSYLRRILNIAERNGWIAKNPFKGGDVLIHSADEVKRERILTLEETQRLIDACTDRRAHLKPLIIAALDTGCRLGELLKLQWQEVDLTFGVIIIKAFNTKTMRKREVGITTRLHTELESLWNSFPQSKEDLVFGVSEVRKSFKSACSKAGLSDLRFHDLRYCHASKLNELGFSVPEIASQLGHTQIQTTLRYINRHKNSVRKVTLALDSIYQDMMPTIEIISELIN